MSRITSSVVNKCCNTSSFTITLLYAISVCLCSLKSGWGDYYYQLLPIILTRPHQGIKLIHFICQRSHIFYEDETSSSFLQFCFCPESRVDIFSPVHLNLLSYSKHCLSFEKLNQLLPHANKFPVGMVTHHNRRKMSARVTNKSFQQHDTQISTENLKKIQNNTNNISSYCNRLPLVHF